MLVLGINAYHADAAACVVVDGRVVAAAEEERFNRIKHYAGFPREAARYCLREAGASARDVDVVAVNSDPSANRGRRLAYAATHPRALTLLRERVAARRRRRDVLEELAVALGAAMPRVVRVARIEHHRAHMASAYYCSGYDRARVVSVDGFGDFSSAAVGDGDGDALRVRRRILFPHSLGIFYQALTQYLGFPAYGDEYKVMGLAPYGEPRFRVEMERLLRLHADGGFELDLEFFRHHRVALSIGADGDAPPHFPALYSPALEALLGPARAPGAAMEQRHRDLARSIQVRYEEAFFNLLQAGNGGSGAGRDAADALALAGGCAMNSVANGKIYARTGFRRVFVQPAAGDAGGALGAALCACADAGGPLPREEMRHAALGPGFDADAIAAAIDSRGDALDAAGCIRTTVADEEVLCRETAAAIAGGEVVGWFQGRMEWGPRALGQRSILADPRRADMRSVLNEKIKRRESFRPFAPAVLRSAVSHWFEIDDDVPFMTKVFPVREECRSRIPAVTHVDGSGRLQTVSDEDNPLFHRLISAFARDTGVPMLLNTSFNENEPVVCRPQEALDCFLRTHMDRLVLGTRVLTRRG